MNKLIIFFVFLTSCSALADLKTKAEKLQADLEVARSMAMNLEKDRQRISNIITTTKTIPGLHVDLLGSPSTTFGPLLVGIIPLLRKAGPFIKKIKDLAKG